jgi:uncharacterized phage-associated protein
VDKVLNHFGGLSVIELEDLFIQKEQPWIEARGNAGKHEHSSEVIPKESIYNFHKKNEMAPSPLFLLILSESHFHM